MKCKHCDGTGTTNWCVNGTFVDCPYCGGTGKMEMEMTNEEWFNELSTETKARIMHIVYMAGYRDGFNGADTIPLRDIKEWLKQPYKE